MSFEWVTCFNGFNYQNVDIKFNRVPGITFNKDIYIKNNLHQVR